MAHGGGQVRDHIAEAGDRVRAGNRATASRLDAAFSNAIEVPECLLDRVLVFARRGIVPEACSSWFLPRLVGISQAAEWCYTGKVFPASEAHTGGLVRSVHAADDLLPAARAIAAEIAENSAPVSVALTRQMLWRMLGADHPMEAHKVDSRGILERGRSADAAEGVTSFLEKRPPRFPVRVSDGLPDIFPSHETRTFS